MSIPAVARQLGRTPAGIQGALRARHWVDPERSKVMRSVHIFTALEQRAFLEFALLHAAGHTPSDIREAWNKEAEMKSWPTVNNERVTYYLRKLGLQKTKSEYAQCASYQRSQRIAQRRRRAKERETQRRRLGASRAEMYAREADLPRRKCEVCGETWPLTEAFFCHSGNSTKYFHHTCRLCCHHRAGTAEERRRQRFLTYDRNVIKQISAARLERDAFLRRHRNFPTRTCARCHEFWEILPKRFSLYKTARGCELYRETCRFCLRAIERFRDRAQRAVSRSHHTETSPATAVGSGA